MEFRKLEVGKKKNSASRELSQSLLIGESASIATLVALSISSIWVDPATKKINDGSGTKNNAIESTFAVQRNETCNMISNPKGTVIPMTSFEILWYRRDLQT
jgi:hypothetical protein